MALSASNVSAEPRAISIGPVKIQILNFSIASGDTSGSVTCDALSSVLFASVTGVDHTAAPTFSGNVITLAFADPVATRHGQIIAMGKWLFTKPMPKDDPYKKINATTKGYLKHQFAKDEDEEEYAPGTSVKINSAKDGQLDPQDATKDLGSGAAGASEDADPLKKYGKKLYENMGFSKKRK